MGNDCEQVETCSESDVLSKHCEIQLGVVCGIQVGTVMIGSLWGGITQQDCDIQQETRCHGASESHDRVRVCYIFRTF